jgi:hypothetical protein
LLRGTIGRSTAARASTSFAPRPTPRPSGGFRAAKRP